jgi:hypothetical protein
MGSPTKRGAQMEHSGHNTQLIAPDRLSTVVGAIYDAAIDPELWPEALRHLCLDLHCMHSAVYLFDAENSCLRHVKLSDPALERIVRNKEYADTFLDFLRVMPIATQPIDEPLLSTQLPSHGSLFDSR